MKNNKLNGTTYGQLQDEYNALHFSFFSKVMKIELGSDQIGNFIDKHINELKKNHTKCKKQYQTWVDTGKSVIV